MFKESKTAFAKYPRLPYSIRYNRTIQTDSDAHKTCDLFNIGLRGGGMMEERGKE